MGNVDPILLVLLCSAGVLAASALPQAPRPIVAGVFLLTDGGSYAYGFAAAAPACRALNATVATLAQVERALRRGLETCKFGWTAEQTAVVPRRTANVNCGKGQTGMVTWPASPDRKFGVFCFSASDSGDGANTSTLRPSPTPTGSTPSPSSTSSTSPAPSSSSTSSTSPSSSSSPSSLSSSTKPPTAVTVGPPETTTPPSTWPYSTPGPPTSTPATRRPSSARGPGRGTSNPADAASSVSATTFPPSVSASPQTTATPLATGPAKPFLGGVSSALLVLGVVLLLLAAALLSYYKLKIFSVWPAGRLKDDVETEMWRRDDSETDVHSGPEEEDEEDRKHHTGEFMLCVNPHFRSNPSLA